MYDLFQFPQVLSQFIHKFILEGQSQFSEHLSAYSFTVAKRVCVEVKKKLAPIDCQKSLQYCKKKKTTKFNCIHWWQVWVGLADEGRTGLCICCWKFPHSANAFPLHVIKNNFSWLCWHFQNANIFLTF